MGRISLANGFRQHAQTTLVVVLLASACSTLVAESVIDRIVAIVDGAPILQSRIEEKITSGPLVAVSEFPAGERSSEFDKALQDSINFELILQRAKELEIEVGDEELDSEIRRFLEQRDLTMDTLMGFLRQQNKSFADYKKDFRDQIVLRRFQGRVIAPLVKVTDKDVETYYLKKTGGSSDVVELTLRQILIRIPPDSTPEISQAKQDQAREVHQKLLAGMNFVEAVKINSDDVGARENGGLMQGIKLRDLSGSIRAGVENLEVGKFSAPIQTTAGLHIFLLEDRKFSGGREFQSQKSNLEFELRNLELAAQTQRWLAEERQRSKVEIIGN